MLQSNLAKFLKFITSIVGPRPHKRLNYVTKFYVPLSTCLFMVFIKLQLKNDRFENVYTCIDSSIGI